MARISTIKEKIECPNCGKTTIQKAGIFDGRQRYHCTSCGKYFFTEFSDRRGSALDHKLAILMHIAGAPIKDIAECLHRAPPTISGWIVRANTLLSGEPEVDELRASTRKKATPTRKPASTDFDKKRWLMIELDDVDSKLPSIVITRKPHKS